jgi:hypothetical protein
VLYSTTKILEKYQRAITKEIVEEEVVSLEKKMGRPKKGYGVEYPV